MISEYKNNVKIIIYNFKQITLYIENKFIPPTKNFKIQILNSHVIIKLKKYKEIILDDKFFRKYL